MQKQMKIELQVERLCGPTDNKDTAKVHNSHMIPQPPDNKSRVMRYFSE